MPALLVVVMSGLGTASAQESPPAGEAVDFAASIRPILARHCLRCHGPDRPKGGLRLDLRDLAFRGGDAGPALEPGNAGESMLLERLTTDDVGARMPYREAPLSSEEVELVRRWIDQGARWPKDEEAGSIAISGHWAFRPVEKPRPPALGRVDWARDPIDRFVLEGLERRGIAPSPEADRTTLLRRLCLDLTGLPPSPDDVREFVADAGPDAYDRRVDRLLASPHFGERWGGHWLDLARYGDSDGFEQDDPRPYAYRWRDWVIDAVNADMPFDRFTVEQIAGDLLPDATESQVLASGFHRNAPTNGEGGADQDEARSQAIVDRVNTTGTVWLGLTVGCAECHSHKFDPLGHSEYYQLYAFFNDAVDEVDRPMEPTEVDRERHRQTVRAYEERLETLEALATMGTAEQRERLKSAIDRMKKTGPPPFKPRLAVFGPASKPHRTHVHRGGDIKNLGPPVAPGVPAVLPGLASRRGDGAAPDRLDLARWLVDPVNPLPARVEANRTWQYLFGVGLVATPDDFGTQGDPPTHPALLDHLAARLVESGWSRKTLIRAIVRSATYRQASSRRPDIDALDPSNRWIHRQNRFRLEAEIVRDVGLAVSGLLDPAVGGPSIRPPLPASFRGFGYKFRWIADAAPEMYRRGLYILYQRNMVYPTLRTFDRPDTNVACVRRERSNTPLQALTLLNDPLAVDTGRALARRLLRGPGRSAGERVESISRLCLGRGPSDEERRVLEALFATLRERYRAEPEEAAALVGPATDAEAPREEIAAWIGVGRVLMNADEFITRE